MTAATHPQLHGILVINKPSGPSSAHCLKIFKRLGQKKIGHAGTLDPLASGVLIALLGQATKLSSYLMEGGEKVYSGALRLGLETDTWDIQGRTLAERPWSGVRPGDVREAIEGWVGEGEQLVPPYSAAKHMGQPLYKLARRGVETPVRYKKITVSKARMLQMDMPVIRFRVACGSGAYIRSLAHSLGKRLGCGAALCELTREYSHPFGLDQAIEAEALLREPESLPGHVLPLGQALPGWPRLAVSAAQGREIRDGRSLRLTEKQLPEGFDGAPLRVLVMEEGKELALGEIRPDSGAAYCAVLRGLWN